MAESVKGHLQTAFEDLGAENLRKFQSKLGDRRQEPRVRRATIEKLKDEIDLADLMVNTFTSRDAVSVTVEILRAINCNAVADELLENTGQSESQSAPSKAESQGAPSKAETKGAPFKVNFIDKHWKALIDRVNNVDPILDVLRQEKVITNEDYCTIRAKETPQKKMRELLTQITSAGDKGKEVLYEALKENNKFLMDDLEKAQ